LLAPHKKDIRVEFESDFAGMTNRDVTVDQLIEVLEQLFRELPASLDELEREFLLSVNRCDPEGEILGLPGIENLPAIQWKLVNLRKLSKLNRTKYIAITDSLSTMFQ
jgi:hypothetical protein